MADVFGAKRRFGVFQYFSEKRETEIKKKESMCERGRVWPL